jgi:hypothetical protein
MHRRSCRLYILSISKVEAYVPTAEKEKEGEKEESTI